MENTTHEIFRINKKLVPDIVDVLCDSFFDYPVMRFVIGSEINYSQKLRILINFFVMARIIREEIILGIGDRPNIDGVALISNPNNSLNPQELKDLKDQVWLELGTQSRSNYQKFSDVCAQFQINVPHIHLNMIGIKNSAQGNGLGRKLIEQVHLLSLNDANSTGVTLTTEDPTKVPFYEYLGYNIIGQSIVAPQLKTWSFFRPN
jgi:hypothetical protein